MGQDGDGVQIRDILDLMAVSYVHCENAHFLFICSSSKLLQLVTAVFNKCSRSSFARNITRNPEPVGHNMSSPPGRLSWTIRAR